MTIGTGPVIVKDLIELFFNFFAGLYAQMTLASCLVLVCSFISEPLGYSLADPTAGLGK